jgi:asparagine synthase (glutamine-hydrolysing)
LSSEADLLGGFQCLELRSTLPDELLMYADKLSMAHSLEVRVPYLDRTIVEYVERLPANLKVRFLERKWIHRRVCRHFLPGEVLRRRKRGFAVNVVDGWFRSSLRGTLGEFLQDPYSEMYRFLSYSAVLNLVAGHRSGRDDNHKLLFSLAVLEQWLRVARPAACPAEQVPR